MYLLDTNVVSELRRPKKTHPNVKAWIDNVPTESLYLSVMAVMELETGVLLMERRDSKQGSILRAWINEYVLPIFAGRIIDIDASIAQRCAALHVPDPRPDRDSLIAATALVHDMMVVTRNVHHFQAMGVEIVNPWEP